jgi:single-stranded-DNA-specific exonuclease
MHLTNLQKEILEKKGFDPEDEKQNKELEKFLNPIWSRDILDSRNIKDIDKSVERIKKATDNNEKIIIYADYDCDGIPGAVILHDFFKKINYENFSVYIPHRHNEGYGLNKNAIQKFIDEKYSLMITVDIGITNIEEIRFAEENNINVIVTDHHLPILDEAGRQILPSSFSIINTKQDDDKYKEKYLCGASTAWKLVNAFLDKYRNEFNVAEGWEKWLLDMVGIATIADLVPLVGENRIFAKYGLEVLKKSKRPGLQKILANAKINQSKINEDDIAFGIAPRINSASRMAEPIHAFYALLQNEESINYANELEKYNDARKQDTKDAHTSIDYENLKSEKIILIGDVNWTPGIIGLIASKVVENTSKTTFVWGLGEDENVLKGSVRAGADGYNVVHIMTEAKDILENFGGHEMAGGFAIHRDNLGKLQEFLRSYPPAPFQRKGGEFRVGKDFEWTLTDKKRYKKLKELSIELRNNETKAEKFLWKNLRGNKIIFPFRRQHIINNFIVDFICIKKGLIIEVDGDIHDLKKEADIERQKFLENFGFTFLRFKNEEVLEDMEKVLKQIEDRLDKATFPLSFGKGSGDRIDFIDIDIKDINRKLFDEISIFAPFGTGNEKIIFKIKLKEDDKLNVKRFGKQNEHLEILINGIRGIDFFANKNREEELKNKKEFLINLEWDNFRGDIVMKFVK